MPHYCAEPSCAQLILTGEYCSGHQTPATSAQPTNSRTTNWSTICLLLIALIITIVYLCH